MLNRPTFGGHINFCEAFGAENEKQTRPHKLLLHQFISQEKVPYSNNADAN